MGQLRVGLGIVAMMAMLMVDGAPLEAQGRSRNKAFRVPPGHMPPPGECRVWYRGVPPGHQPPAVPCRALRGHHFPGAVIVHTPFERQRGRKHRDRDDRYFAVDSRHRDAPYQDARYRDARYRDAGFFVDVWEPDRGGFLEVRLVFGN